VQLFALMECKKNLKKKKYTHFLFIRSYNEQLFPQAVEVLERIRHPSERIAAFLKLGEHIKVNQKTGN
jgi:glutamate racemase